MDNNLIYSEFFDKYLKGKLSENERMAFEKKVEQDPLLHSELKLQKEIYVALGETRKAALKSRLDQVPVNNAGWFNMSGAKIAAVIGSVLVMTTVSYFYINSKTTDSMEAQVVEIDPSYASPKISEEDMAVAVPSPNIEQVPNSAEISNNTTKETESLSVAADVKPKREVTATKNKEKDLFPEIRRPDLNISFAEETQKINYEDFEAPKKQIIESMTFDDSKVDIETVFHERYNFHYQFEDHKLYLYGNFGDTLYKIIALNSDKGKQLFLEFNEHFYAIDHQQAAIAPLQLIEDTALLKELKRISP